MLEGYIRDRSKPIPTPNLNLVHNCLHLVFFSSATSPKERNSLAMAMIGLSYQGRRDFQQHSCKNIYCKYSIIYISYKPLQISFPLPLITITITYLLLFSSLFMLPLYTADTNTNTNLTSPPQNRRNNDR